MAPRIRSIAACLVLAGPGLAGEAQALLKLEGTIALPGVKGRIDHMACDAKRGRLFVAALENGSLEAVDLESRKRAESVEGLKEPQGAWYLGSEDRVAVASGGDGTCRLYDEAKPPLRLLKTFEIGDDADNVRADAAEKRVYVAYGEGAIAAIDLESGAVAATAKLEGHPESFQLESKGKRIFSNVPAAREVAVIDREKMEVVARWKIEGARDNFPLALHEEAGKLLVVCRRPPRLVVLDSATGVQVEAVECSGDADDVFRDPVRQRVYISCGEGFIDVFDEGAAGHRRIAKVPTRKGARTSLFVPSLDRLFLAVPAAAGEPAEIRVYSPEPRATGESPRPQR